MSNMQAFSSDVCQSRAWTSKCFLIHELCVVLVNRVRGFPFILLLQPSGRLKSCSKHLDAAFCTLRRLREAIDRECGAVD
jgi:hypothetical protein